jgi:hypothetical protein
MTNMNHKSNLQKYAASLVCDYANHDGDTYTLSIHDLTTDEQGELARLYMEFTNRETTECIHGKDFSLDNEFTCALLALLHEDTSENKERLSTVIRRNIILYYEDTLQSILDESCNDHLHAENLEHGLRARKHRDNGEIYWSRY